MASGKWGIAKAFGEAVGRDGSAPKYRKYKESAIRAGGREGREAFDAGYTKGEDQAAAAENFADLGVDDYDNAIEKIAKMDSDAEQDAALSNVVDRTSRSMAYDKMRQNGKNIPLADDVDELNAEVNLDGITDEFAKGLIEALKRHGREQDVMDVIEAYRRGDLE